MGQKTTIASPFTPIRNVASLMGHGLGPGEAIWGSLCMVLGGGRGRDLVIASVSRAKLEQHKAEFQPLPGARAEGARREIREQPFF